MHRHPFEENNGILLRLIHHLLDSATDCLENPRNLFEKKSEFNRGVVATSEYPAPNKLLHYELADCRPIVELIQGESQVIKWNRAELSSALSAIIDWDELSELNGQKSPTLGQIVLLCELEHAQKFSFPSGVMVDGLQRVAYQPQSELSRACNFLFCHSDVRKVILISLMNFKLAVWHLAFKISL